MEERLGARPRMYDGREARRATDGHTHATAESADPTREDPPRAVPGKRTLVDMTYGDLELPRAVQAKGQLTGDDALATAARGVAGASSELPYAATIQKLFGRHDVSGVRTQIAGAAASASLALGARAYAVGLRIAFAASPDLRTAAHEAAHVIQQAHGLQLADGLGRPGDAHEQHADAVADAVVAGHSAEALLDRYAESGGPATAVQGMWQPPEDPVALAVQAATKILETIHDLDWDLEKTVPKEADPTWAQALIAFDAAIRRNDRDTAQQQLAAFGKLASLDEPTCAQIDKVLTEHHHPEQSAQPRDDRKDAPHERIAIARPPAHATWDLLGNGEHSFAKLNEAMFVQCKMAPVPESDAEIVFFNFKLAEDLGLELPRNEGGVDEAALARLVLKTFAWRTVEPGAEHDGARTMIATRYQDAKGNTDNDPKGDGRVVWSGELRGAKTPDVQLKGVGKTSLEWTGHSKGTHQDGLQSLGEGAHSFMISLINEANGLESTRDLALIKLKHVIKDDEERSTHDPATITVRIGSQLRMGHVEYWSQHNERGPEMADYAIRRALAIDHALTPPDIERYIYLYAQNSARDAATQYYLHSFHGSMTRGNRTTEGLPIDNGTWNYLDAHHNRFTAGPMEYGAQAGMIRANISELLGLLDTHDFLQDLGVDSDPLLSSAEKHYDQVFAEELRKLLLGRLGYSDEDVARILELASKDKTMALVDDYIKAMRGVYDAQSTDPDENKDEDETERKDKDTDKKETKKEGSVMGKDIAPAQINARRALLGIVRFVGQFGPEEVPWHSPQDPKERAEAVADLEAATEARYMQKHAEARTVPAWTSDFPPAEWETVAAKLRTEREHRERCKLLLALADTVFALTRYLYKAGIKMEPVLIEQRNRPRPGSMTARDALWSAFDQQVRKAESLAARNEAILQVGAPYIDR